MDKLMECSQIVRTAITDKQTVIIQYNKPSDIHIIKSYIHGRRRPNSFSIITDWLYSEAFINLNGDDTDKPENEWVRIIYECLYNNPNPHPINTRFKDCLILHADINALIGGIQTNDNTGRISKLSNK